MILHGIEYQRPTSLNMRIMADHVTYSFLAFMKSIFHFCLGCYCGGYSQNGRSNLSSCSRQWPAIFSHIAPGLTHWGWDKMAATLQTTCWSAFSSMKKFEFWLKFHWNLLLVVVRVHMTLPALVLVMAWHRTGDKPLFNQWWPSSLIHMHHLASMS